jgi:hypothetical protein
MIMLLILNKMLFLINVRDINCSMKIFKRNVLNSFRIESDSAFIDAELLAKTRKKGFKIGETGVHHYAREHGEAGGAKLKVVLGTIKEMLLMRLKLFFK